MSTTKIVMDLLESARIARERYLSEMYGELASETVLIAILNEILTLQQQVASLSTAITSATSSSGTKTEDVMPPIVKHGS